MTIIATSPQIAILNPALLIAAPEPLLMLPAFSGVRPFEYASNRLMALDHNKRDQLFTAVARVMDAAVLYLTGQSTVSTFSAASGNFYQAINHMVSGRTFPVREPKLTSSPNVVQDSLNRMRSRYNEAGQRLGQLLSAIVGLECEPKGGTHQVGPVRYHLKTLGKPGDERHYLIFEKQIPGSRAAVTSNLVATRMEYEAELARLDQEIAHRLAPRKDGPVTSRAIIERATPTDNSPRGMPRLRTDLLRPEDWKAAERGWNNAY